MSRSQAESLFGCPLAHNRCKPQSWNRNTADQAIWSDRWRTLLARLCFGRPFRSYFRVVASQAEPNCRAVDDLLFALLQISDEIRRLPRDLAVKHPTLPIVPNHRRNLGVDPYTDSGRTC